VARDAELKPAFLSLRAQSEGRGEADKRLTISLRRTKERKKRERKLGPLHMRLATDAGFESATKKKEGGKNEIVYWTRTGGKRERGKMIFCFYPSFRSECPRKFFGNKNKAGKEEKDALIHGCIGGEKNCAWYHDYTVPICAPRQSQTQEGEKRGGSGF